jgi:hypothetical protein
MNFGVTFCQWAILKAMVTCIRRKLELETFQNLRTGYMRYKTKSTLYEERL